MGHPDSECVRVVVRCRPLNEKEKSDQRQRIVDVDVKAGQVLLRNPSGDASDPAKAFAFDAVFDWDAQQRAVYDDAAHGIVESVLEGYNGTIFAYGQTGTGKTHTMEGVAADDPGIIPQCFEHIFSAIGASADRQYLVRASYLEIYNEEVRDLLSKSPKERLEVKEHREGGVYVRGLNAFVVKSVAEIRNVLEVGKRNRSVGATLMNQESSRSHSVFTITVECVEHAAGADGHIRVGKLNLVDLAGSERQAKTGATGDRLREATRINLSLCALGNVISALVDGKSGHVPYRDSKLTRLLQDSLGGNTKTVMIANIGPADWNYEESLASLRYANRAKNIRNRPRVNEDPKDAMLREFQEEIARLRAALQMADTGAATLGDDACIPPLMSAPSSPAPLAPPSARLDPDAVDTLRAEIEAQLKAELEGRMASGALPKEQLDAIHKEAAERAGAESARILQQRARADAAAAKYERKQREMQEQLAARQEESAALAAAKEALRAKLRSMEGKLLKGEARGGLVEMTKRKEAEIERRERELERRRGEQAAAAARIAEMEDAALAAGEACASLAEEAAAKARKLEKLWRKYQEVAAEVDDAYREFQAEREDLLDSLRLLDQQMALKARVIQAFVPPEEVAKVMARAQWDEERDAWVLERLSDPAVASGVGGRPIATLVAARPMCAMARCAIAAGDMNPRFRSENILALELDLPERSTFDTLDALETATTQVTAAMGAMTWADPQRHMVYAVVQQATTGQRAFLAEDVGLVGEGAQRRQGQQQQGSRAGGGRARPASAGRMRSRAPAAAM